MKLEGELKLFDLRCRCESLARNKPVKLLLNCSSNVPVKGFCVAVRHLLLPRADGGRITAEGSGSKTLIIYLCH